MKIIYPFAYFGSGGAEEHAILLANSAKNAGHEVLFVVSKMSDLGDKKLKSAKLPFCHLEMESSFNPFLVLRSALDLKRIILDFKADIVHTHMLREQSIAIFAKVFGAKFGLFRTFHRLDQFNALFRFLRPIYLHFTDGNIATSESMANVMDKNGWGGRYVLVENGVTKVNAPSHKKAIGFIGRLTKEKGILDFVRSNIDILKKNRLVIAGDGPDADDIRKISKDHDLMIEMLGNIVDKASFYREISVLVLPSETEVLPLVVLEAYSCGLPVVAFDIESLKNLVKEENGVLVKYPNYPQVGEMAKKLLNHTKEYSSINVKLFEARYSDKIMWRKTLAVYESVS